MRTLTTGPGPPACSICQRPPTGAPVLQDYGSTYASGTATHHLTLYRAPSGALVFGAGTVQWSWGLDGHHDGGTTTPDVRMQQATVNLLADMGVQPATLQSGLTAATKSTDVTAPTSTISAPAAGANVQSGTPVTITGTATDAGGGVVGGVEVSVDGGATWHPATGRGSWSYTWTPGGTSGPVTIKSRAVDDSGNLETPGAGITVNVQGGRTTRPAPVSSAPRRRPKPRTLSPTRPRGWCQVHLQCRRHHHRHPLLQELDQHGHTRGQPVDQHRHAAGAGHLRQRDGLGLAAGQLHYTSADQRQHHLRCLVPHQRRPLRRGR